MLRFGLVPIQYMVYKVLSSSRLKGRRITKTFLSAQGMSAILNAVSTICCCGIWGPNGLELPVLNLNDQGKKLVLIGEILV